MVRRCRKASVAIARSSWTLPTGSSLRRISACHQHHQRIRCLPQFRERRAEEQQGVSPRPGPLQPRRYLPGHAGAGRGSGRSARKLRIHALASTEFCDTKLLCHPARSYFMFYCMKSMQSPDPITCYDAFSVNRSAELHKLPAGSPTTLSFIHAR